MLLRSSLVRRASLLTRSLSRALPRTFPASCAPLPCHAPFSASASAATPGFPMPAVAVVRYDPSPSSAVERTTILTPSPKPHELLIRVTATSINPIDADVATGYGAAALEAMRGPLPVVLGREGVGIVERVGSAVWDFSPGDRVWFAPSPVQTPGAHAKYITVSRSAVSQAPSNLSDAEAASIPYSALTAWAALVDVAGVVRPDTSPSAPLGAQLSSHAAGAGLDGGLAALGGGLRSAAAAVSSAASAAAAAAGSGGGAAAVAASLLSSLTSAAAGGGALAANMAASAAAAAPQTTAAAAALAAAAATGAGASAGACKGAGKGGMQLRRGPFSGPAAPAPAPVTTATPATTTTATTTTPTSTPAAAPAVSVSPAGTPTPSGPSSPKRTRVLIHGGSGPLGLIATQLLSLHGVSVAVTCAPRNADAARNAGACDAVDYRGAEWGRLNIKWDGTAGSIEEGSEEAKADVLLDCVGGSPATLSQAVKKGGTIVSVHSLLKDFNSTSTSSSSTFVPAAAATLVSGAVSAVANFSSASAAASARGVRFMPAFFRSNGDALGYLKRLAEAGVVTPVVDTVVGSVEEGFKVFEGRRKQRDAEGSGGQKREEQQGEVKQGRRGGKVVIVPTWE